MSHTLTVSEDIAVITQARLMELLRSEAEKARIRQTVLDYLNAVSVSGFNAIERAAFARLVEAVK